MPSLEKTCGLWLFCCLPEMLTIARRRFLHDQSARYTIPPKVNTKQPWPFVKETYKRRNVIERFFNRLKEFRRAETRYDKRDDSFLAFVMVAAICVAFGILHI